MLRTGPSNECQVEESIMAVMEQEYSRELHALFAKCLHAYLECSTEVQAVIRDMVNIVISPESDEDEREMALFTMASALFPEYDGGAAGVDAEEAERAYDENGPEGLAARVELDEQETTFAARLRQIMDRKNLTQVQLAEKARVGQPAISMMLNRKCRPQQRTVHKLAESLGVHPEELWPG